MVAEKGKSQDEMVQQSGFPLATASRDDHDAGTVRILQMAESAWGDSEWRLHLNHLTAVRSSDRFSRQELAHFRLQHTAGCSHKNDVKFLSTVAGGRMQL
jgi:hypothetical protein